VPLAKKTRTKETGNCLFLLAWGLGQRPKNKKNRLKRGTN